jgi:transposase
MPIKDTFVSYYLRSTGCIYKKQRLVSDALKEPVADLLNQVKASSSAHMDETGHRRDGLNQWLWGMMSETAAFFLLNHLAER